MHRQKLGRPKTQVRRSDTRRAGWLLVALVGIAPLLTGCGGESEASERPKVLTTFTVLADIAVNVGGGLIDVESITKPGADVHAYEPTPSDLRRAAGADLILDNGLGLERWFEDFVDRIDAPHVVVSDGVETLPIADGAYEGKDNPHAWMSPLNAATYAQNMADAFADLDPANAGAYQANADAYMAELRAVNDELVAAVSTLPEPQRALVTCEGAFSYLARDAGLTEAYLWPVNGDEQGTPQQIADTIGFVRDNDVPAVFCESTVSHDTQRQVAREAGTELGGTLYVDSLSEPNGPVPTYVDMIRHDVETIVDGLVNSP